MNCYWDRDSVCRHPRIGGAPVDARCDTCTYKKSTDLTVRGEPVGVRKFLQDQAAKALGYAKAEASLILEGPLPEEEYQARISACRACPHLDPSTEDSAVGWCKSCGCGKNVRAELTVKARMPAAKCPIGKWPRKDGSNA